MHPNKRQTIIEKLTYIATHTTDSSLFRSSPPPIRYLGIDNGWAICLTDEAYKTYDKVCDMLASETSWKEKLSRHFIIEDVHAMLRQIIKDGDTDAVPTYLDIFLTKCKQFNETYNVYLPLDNILMQCDRLIFGKTMLISMNPAQLDECIHQLTTTIDDQVECEQIVTHWRRDTLPLLQDKVVAMYTISAEHRRAQELAEAEWYRFLDILRYFIFLSDKKQHYIDVGLCGDVRYGVGKAILLSSTHPIFMTNTALKSPQPLLIDSKIENDMHQCGVFALAELLNPESKTEFTDTLFAGIHWVSNALIQSEPANEYLSSVSCLETFLTRSRGDLGSIGNTVSTGVGWVLGRDPANRLALHKEVKDIYAKRSTISHGGKQEDISKLLPRLRDIVSDFILQMVLRRDEFSIAGNRDYLTGLIKALSVLSLLTLKSKPDVPSRYIRSKLYGGDLIFER